MTELNSYWRSAFRSFFFASINFIRTPLVCETLEVGRDEDKEEGRWTSPRAACERIAGGDDKGEEEREGGGGWGERKFTEAICC